MKTERNALSENYYSAIVFSDLKWERYMIDRSSCHNVIKVSKCVVFDIVSIVGWAMPTMETF